MIERGKGCDPPIHFSYGGVVSQTTDSHRLIEKAYELKGEEGQLRLVERYVRALSASREHDCSRHCAFCSSCQANDSCYCVALSLSSSYAIST